MAAELWLPPSAERSEFKKAPPPKLGNKFGSWAGQDMMYAGLPGGGVLQFDLSRLTLQDYRQMRDHYQINASLSVLAFMMHRLDWSIECENQKIADAVEENMRLMWTRLIRGISQAYWSGYSPMVIDWENDIEGRRVVATRFKDLVPEDCVVNWKTIEGYAPPNHAKPKFKQFDGIKQRGVSWPIPALNSLWYPLLMENGDYYGKKLLRPAFPSWFFSILMHLFANRYFERFGEPVPIGRADFEAEVNVAGTPMNGHDAMVTILNALRSRAVVVLPSDRTQVGDGSRSEYDFDIEYLESQMRGADFERYLYRLDEEMSIGIFTPTLLLRTADVGSYNLGVGHMQMYMWMLNALAGDMKEYIDRYYVWRFVDFNFGPRAPRAFWKPREMGKESVETMRAVVQALIAKDKLGVDVDELGTAIGLSLKEIRAVTGDDPEGGGGPDQPDPDKGDGPKGVGEPRATGKEIAARIRIQVAKAFREGSFGHEFQPTLGYRRRFEESLKAEGAAPDAALKMTNELYDRMGRWMGDVMSLGMDEFKTSDQFMGLFEKMLETEIDSLARR